VSEEEFEKAGMRWRRLLELDRTEAIAQACRGSGDPAALAWIAEGLRLEEGARVVDIGGGLGGPSAWLVDRYRVLAFPTDPVREGLVGAHRVFGLPPAAADGAALPFRDGSFDAALVLAVLSVVDDPVAVLREACRLAPACGILAYVAAGPDAVRCGGSRFPSRDEVGRWIEEAGLELVAGPAEVDLPAPPGWADDGDSDDPSEDEVTAAIDEGRIGPAVLIAQRRP
jgi:SAM-dependent methyltransferase